MSTPGQCSRCTAAGRSSSATVTAAEGTTQSLDADRHWDAQTCPIAAAFKETWHHVAVVRNGIDLHRLRRWRVERHAHGFIIEQPGRDAASGTQRRNPSAVLRVPGRRRRVQRRRCRPRRWRRSPRQDVDGHGSRICTPALSLATDRPPACPASLTRPVTYVAGAHTVILFQRIVTMRSMRAKLPLSLVSHMRLPFAQGQIANVVQGFGDPSVSHNGYAAFCYDFGFPQRGHRRLLSFKRVVTRDGRARVGGRPKHGVKDRPISSPSIRAAASSATTCTCNRTRVSCCEGPERFATTRTLPRSVDRERAVRICTRR